MHKSDCIEFCTPFNPRCWFPPWNTVSLLYIKANSWITSFEAPLGFFCHNFSTSNFRAVELTFYLPSWRCRSPSFATVAFRADLKATSNILDILNSFHGALFERHYFFICDESSPSRFLQFRILVSSFCMLVLHKTLWIDSKRLVFLGIHRSMFSNARRFQLPKNFRNGSLLHVNVKNLLNCDMYLLQLQFQWVKALMFLTQQ